MEKLVPEGTDGERGMVNKSEELDLLPSEPKSKSSNKSTGLADGGGEDVIGISKPPNKSTVGDWVVGWSGIRELVLAECDPRGLVRVDVGVVVAGLPTRLGVRVVVAVGVPWPWPCPIEGEKVESPTPWKRAEASCDDLGSGEDVVVVLYMAVIFWCS